MRWIRSLTMTWVVAVVAYLHPAIGTAQQAYEPPVQFLAKWRDGLSLQERSPAVLDSLEGAERLVQVSVTYVATLTDGTEILRATQPLTRQQVSNFLTAMRGGPLEYLEEDVFLRAAATDPGDPLFVQQDPLWFIKVPRAWDISTGQGAVIAVLDTGIRSHEDLDANVLPGYDFIRDPAFSNDGDGRDPNATEDFDPGNGTLGCAPQNAHGTRIAGVIAAVGRNNLGIAGVAFNSRIVPIRVLGHCGGGYVSDVAEAITWAAGGSIAGVPPNDFRARVINLSLSAIGACSRTLQNAVTFANERGSVVIAPAGNRRVLDERQPSPPMPPADAALHTPGNCPNVISVAGVDPWVGPHRFSAYGPTVTLAAPIRALTLKVTDPPTGDLYGDLWGTSVATAYTSGVAGLLFSQFQGFTPAHVTARLRDVAQPFHFPCEGCGSGTLDAAAALAAARQPDERPGAPPNLRVTPAAPRPSLHTQYRLSWNRVQPADSYQVTTIRIEPLPALYFAVRMVSDGTSIDFVPPEPGLYRHTIAAVNGSQRSALASIDVAFMDADLEPKSAPKNFRAEPALSGDGSTNLLFDAVPTATSYILNQDGVERVVTASPIRFIGLTDRAYTFTLRARNAYGEGPTAEPITVTVDTRAPLSFRPDGIRVDVENGRSTTGSVVYTWDRPERADYFKYWFNPEETRITTGTTLRLDNQPYGTFTLHVLPCRSLTNRCSFAGTAPAVTVVPPDPPALIGASPSTSLNGSYTVRWNPAAGATNYQVRRCRIGVTPTPPCNTPISVSGESHLFTSQPAGDAQHQVRAGRAGRFGPWSAPGANVTVCSGQCR